MLGLNMSVLTVANLVNEIAKLDRKQTYPYVGGRSLLRIVDVIKPEGGIIFDTIDTHGKVIPDRRIPTDSLATVAGICSRKPNFPLQFDRLFNAGGNTRSALETMLAYTEHFFVCYPERVDSYSGQSRRDLRHLMWCPDKAHPLGQQQIIEYDDVINEVEVGLDFGQIDLSLSTLDAEFDTIEAKRTHTQMQIALVEIGNALGFETWIARNDRSIVVGNRSMGQMTGVIESLDQMPVLYTREAREVASLIDAIWVSEQGRRLAAVIEVEHSTGVTSGLTRMSKLRHAIPSIDTIFAVIAPDTLRGKVVSEVSQTMYKDLKARFMPYSTVRELYGLIQKYPLTNLVDSRFIQAFMEIIVSN
jgi:type II restriction enzyme